MESAGFRLRQAWSDRPIMIPGVFNALTAKLAERLGFPAVYLSGGALSAGWAGLPDVGLLTLTEFAEQAAVLARATSLPLLCDADTGFGEAINVERTVQLFERAGAARLHLEEEVLTNLRDRGTQRGDLGRMQSRAELYELLGYADWEARDRAYFGGPGSQEG